jgi:hypothetical protein
MAPSINPAKAADFQIPTSALAREAAPVRLTVALALALLLTVDVYSDALAVTSVVVVPIKIAEAEVDETRGVVAFDGGAVAGMVMLFGMGGLTNVGA